MTDIQDTQTGHSPADFVRAASPWLAGLGLLFVGFGILAIAHPSFTAIATGLIISYIFLLAGLASLVAIAGDKSAGGKIAHLVFGLLALAAGAFLLFSPTDGAVELVWLIGAVFVVSGIVDLLSAMRAAAQRVMKILLGIINIAIGFYALLLVPSDAIDILALLVGISLILRGIVLAMLALFVRRLAA